VRGGGDADTKATGANGLDYLGGGVADEDDATLGRIPGGLIV